MSPVPPFNDLSGSLLEDWFQKFLNTKLEFKDYYPTSGQIELKQFDSSAPDGEHIELDAILFINRTGVLLEYTSEGGKFRDKIKKFLRNAQIFLKAGNLTLKERLKLFGVPDDRLDDLEEVNSWRLAFFGTHPEFENREYHPNEFLEFSVATDLRIFKPDQIEYLRQLSNLIGVFGRNELLAVLGFAPIDLGDTEESLTLECVKAKGKYITESSDVKADVYLVKMNVMQLLKMARVSRYEGIPLIIENDGQNQSYQRFLKSEKLESIATKFIENNKRKTFPNTITLALSNDCQEVKSKLMIPKRFSSLDIIDGQHRLFGYTHEQISQEVREESDILATAIKFRAESPDEIAQNAARVFCEINSTQAKVQKDLLYLIKYDVLGDRDFPALAGKVILDCHKRTGKPLHGIFLISSLKRKNRLNMPPVEITEIVDKDLIPLMRGINTEDNHISSTLFESIFEIPSDSYSTNPSQLCHQTLVLVEGYFNHVSYVFNNDWTPNAETYLLTSSYISAFLRLLRYQLFELEIQVNDIRTQLELLRSKIDLITSPDQSPSFPINHLSLPNPSEGVDPIYDFLKSLS